MEKKYEDDELDQLINEQFINEAQIMEEALFSDDDTEDYKASDEEIKASYQQLVARLKAEGVYREDGKDRGDANRNCREKYNANDDCSEEDHHNGQEGKTVKESSLPAHDYVGDERSRRSSNTNKDKDSDIFNTSVKNTTTMPGTENTINMSGKTDKVISVPETKKRFNAHKVGKVAGIIVVSGLCVFAASMTSEANRNYFVRNVKYLTGDRTKIIIGNDESNEDVDADEYKALKDIETQLGIDVPEFFYHPLVFYQYEIYLNDQAARIEYRYNDYIIEFRMDKTDNISASRVDSLHGKELETINVMGNDIDISITQIKDEQDKIPSYIAQWKMNDTIYYITGKIEINELKKILEYMRFSV